MVLQRNLRKPWTEHVRQCIHKERLYLTPETIEISKANNEQGWLSDFDKTY